MRGPFSAVKKQDIKKLRAATPHEVNAEQEPDTQMGLTVCLDPRQKTHPMKTNTF